MPYTPNPAWEDSPSVDTPITAAALQNIEDGVDTAHDAIDNHIADTTDAHDASAISVTPAGIIGSTDVQAALVELSGEIVAGGLPSTLFDNKGEILSATANDDASIVAAATADNLVLTSLSSENTGLTWIKHVATAAVAASGVNLVSSKLLAADAEPAFKIMGDGKVWWGAGGSTAVDTDLYRVAADFLQTDDQFGVARASTADYSLSFHVTGESQRRFAIRADGVVEWGSGSLARDTNLYRYAANTLRTDDTFQVDNTSGIVVINEAAGSFRSYATTADSQPEVRIGTGPAINFGPGGSTATDTNLYRSAANVLKTDDTLFVANLGVPITAAAVGGAQGNKFPVYNSATGAFVGWVPIYAT